MSKPKARTVDVHEAKTNFSRLLELVERGEEVVIARAGRLVARLSRLTILTADLEIARYPVQVER